MKKISSSPKTVISSFRFAEIADVIYSGVFLKSQLSSLNLKVDISEYVNDSEYFFVRSKNFKIKENDIIFCKTEYVRELFYLLKKQCKFKNIKLITHQSDLSIGRSLYMLKPSCISEWYSVNVDLKRKDLFPIPIGVANFHKKNLNETFFNSQNDILSFLKTKEKLLYVNFNPNTNFSHRKGLLELFKNKNWASVDENTLDHTQYSNNIMNHSFMLSPWGNGIDTHRFWEALYSGTIPISKFHTTNETFTTIPKLLIKKYKSITKESLLNYIEDLKKNKNLYDLTELDFNYWKNLILKNQINDVNKKEILIVNNLSWFRRSAADYKHKIKSKLKIVNRVRRYVYKKIKL